MDKIYGMPTGGALGNDPITQTINLFCVSQVSYEECLHFFFHFISFIIYGEGSPSTLMLVFKGPSHKVKLN